MATITVTQRYHRKKDGTKQVAIRISHEGVNRYVDTGISVKACEFKNGEIKKSVHGWPKLNKQIRDLTSIYSEALFTLQRSGSFHVDDIISLADTAESNISFLHYAKEYNKRFRGSSPNSYRRHKTVINKFQGFIKRPLQFDQLTAQVIKQFITHLSAIGNSTNTINGNVKYLRTVWNKAYSEGIHTITPSPFGFIKLKSTRSVKERLTLSEIKKLEEVNLPSSTWEDKARDLFLASFYLGGIRFADICTLTGDNIEDGNISYVMNKTNRRITIPIVEKLSALLRKYDGTRKDLLFPIIKDSDLNSSLTELFKTISSKNAIVNKALKRAGSKANIKKNITFHLSRHSFADISRTCDIPVYDISKMLGHSNIGITENYLESIDQRRMEDSFRKVLGD